MADCDFCNIADGIDEALIIYDDESTLAFLDISPASKGHTLVIPRRHYENLLDVDEPDAAAVMVSASRVARLLQESLRPNGFTLLQANEVAGWQGIFHLHVHIIPRWDENELQSPWWPQPADRDELRATAAAIREHRASPRPSGVL